MYPGRVAFQFQHLRVLSDMEDTASVVSDNLPVMLIHCTSSHCRLVTHGRDFRLDFNPGKIPTHWLYAQPSQQPHLHVGTLQLTSSHRVSSAVPGTVDLMLGDLLGQLVSAHKHRKPSLKKTQRRTDVFHQPCS